MIGTYLVDRPAGCKGCKLMEVYFGVENIYVFRKEIYISKLYLSWHNNVSNNDLSLD